MDDSVTQATAVAKALSDPNRLRALAALTRGELCVCQIMELLELVPSTVSKHMSVLRQAGLVAGRKRGKWMYYSLPSERDRRRTWELLSWFLAHIESDDRIRADRIRLKSIACR